MCTTARGLILSKEAEHSSGKEGRRRGGREEGLLSPRKGKAKIDSFAQHTFLEGFPCADNCSWAGETQNESSSQTLALKKLSILQKKADQPINK